MGKRLKVLVIAYACDPYCGSEYAVGWGWLKEISCYHDVSVITADFHRVDLERYERENPSVSSGIQYHYVPPKPWHYHWQKRGWQYIEKSFLKPIMNLSYVSWQENILFVSLFEDRRAYSGRSQQALATDP